MLPRARSPSQRGPVECWYATDTDAPSRSTAPLCHPSGVSRWYWSSFGFATVPCSSVARVSAIASGAAGTVRRTRVDLRDRRRGRLVERTSHRWRWTGRRPPCPRHRLLRPAGRPGRRPRRPPRASRRRRGQGHDADGAGRRRHHRPPGRPGSELCGGALEGLAHLGLGHLVLRSRLGDEQRPHPVERAHAAVADRSVADAQQLRHLADAAVLEVAQHQHHPVGRCEPGQRLGDQQLQVGRRGPVRVHRIRRLGVRQLAGRPPPSRAQESADQRRLGVRRRVVDRSAEPPVPAHVDLGQRLLDEVLGLVHVTAQQPRGPAAGEADRARANSSNSVTPFRRTGPLPRHTPGKIVRRVRRAGSSPSCGPAPSRPSSS